MSDNPLKKISQLFIIKIILILFLGGIITVNAKLISDSLVKAQGIDDKIVSEANPRLNKKLVDQAIDILNSSKAPELTTISPDAKVENEANISDKINATSIEIQNGSGITGAAAEIAEQLANAGYQIRVISTALSKEVNTSIYYLAGKADVAKEAEKLLLEKNWPVTLIEEKDSGLNTDLLIILGK
jgi:hypothetical protein